MERGRASFKPPSVTAGRGGVDCFKFGLVSKTAKPAANQPSGGKEPPFEEALKKLEAVVEAMESDELPLETLMARYEEGTRLAKICQTKLAEAELRIQRLEKDASGEFKVKPFEKEDEVES